MPCYERSLQRDPGMEVVDQSRPIHANADLVQCFHIKRHWPWKCIGIAIFMAQEHCRYLIVSIGDNCINI